MKKVIVSVLVLFSIAASGQNKVTLTDEFKISGKVKSEVTITVDDLNNLESQKINDEKIDVQTGQIKDTTKYLKGILLKDILGKVEFDEEDSKEFSDFFITCVASDGYKVVFSMSEIFNTENGNEIYIVTEKDGKKIDEMENRILMVSLSDFKTKRRNLKGLRQIIIDRAP